MPLRRGVHPQRMRVRAPEKARGQRRRGVHAIPLRLVLIRLKVPEQAVGDAEREQLLAKFASKPCRFGKHCKTNGCLYAHPKDPAALAAEEAGAARGQAMDREARLAAQERQLAMYDKIFLEQQQRMAGMSLGPNSPSSSQGYLQQHQQHQHQHHYHHQADHLHDDDGFYASHSNTGYAGYQDEAFYQQQLDAALHPGGSGALDASGFSSSAHDPYAQHQYFGHPQQQQQQQQQQLGYYGHEPLPETSDFLPGFLHDNEATADPTGAFDLFAQPNSSAAGATSGAASASRPGSWTPLGGHAIEALAPSAPTSSSPLSELMPTPSESAAASKAAPASPWGSPGGAIGSKVRSNPGQAAPSGRPLTMAERLKQSAMRPAPVAQLAAHTSLQRQAQVVRVPQVIWTDCANRDAAAFHITDPVERFNEVNKNHKHPGVMDLHFQTSQTVGTVLDHILSTATPYSSEGGYAYVWLTTGTGHHTTQRLYKLFDVVRDYLDENEFRYKIGKDSNGHFGAFQVRLKR
eukprot:CAMPEP_0202070714 /NCGR_PEP_ID=MMETSP0964-20121228/1351_1 /ASSEMBLY_ACC=CAM_ASM_000500 /TAXON_ID=4773 /ORGANISM="Schizochytrium aggregatum, Strain ATCC28209" /LENGTH=518 /DNA_ID=CAMNT_0048637619 /DNA_START=154 /DNA_END=1711 /DNA_ORIENTATION=-